MVHAAPLTPLAAPISVTPGDNVAKTEVTLCIREQFLAMHSPGFPIINAASGEKMFDVKGSILTLHDRKTFRTADGKTDLFEVRHHHDQNFTFIGERLDIFDAGIMFTDPMAAVFIVKPAVDATDGATMRAQVCIPHKETGRSTYGPKLALIGEFDNEAGAPIVDTETGNTVAVIRRTSDEAIGKLAMAHEPESYFVTIAPGMDVACMAGIVVCFDELHNSVKRHTHANK